MKKGKKSSKKQGRAPRAKCARELAGLKKRESRRRAERAGIRGRLSGERASGFSAVGRFSGTRSGYGFATVEGIRGDVFIPAGRTGGAIDGDTVRLRVRSSARGRDGEERYEGEVISVVALGRSTLVGTYLTGELFDYYGRRRRGHARHFVVPDDDRLAFEVPVAPPGEDVLPGDKVEIAFSGRAELRGEILRSFGPASSKAANCDAILAECGIRTEFEPDAERQAELAAGEVISDEGRVRRDDELIFTIDGASAKDLDDAISLRRLSGGRWLLGVHIADVSHYVLPKTPLDRAVMERGTSVYFVDRVVPMLPPALSNGACSLNAGEDKYALSACITLSESGEILGCRIEPSIIRSRVRGVYSEVNDLLEKGKGSEFYPKYREVYSSLLRMHELSLVLAERSRRRGALSLDRPEAAILLGEDGYPTDIVRIERGDAERLIEQFMLTANEAVAIELTKRQLPCVYRIHEEPPQDKLAEFALYARGLGLDTSAIEGREVREVRAADLLALIDEARERGLAEAISYPLLRSLSKARYSEYAKPHFGLGLSLYCHFTSPIRRLSDLATHRIIRATLIGSEPAKQHSGYAARAALAATEAELRALEAERRIEALYRALWLEGHIGETFAARVSSVTAFGFFAELENTCEGLVPLASLPGVFLYDGRSMTLSSGRQVFRSGDPVTVRIEEVEPFAGRVRFALCEPDGAQAEHSASNESYNQKG